MATATLRKQVWTGQIMKRFYPDTSFLKYAKDYSQFVEADAVQLAEAGVDPAVYINNTTYPIPVSDRVDTPLVVELDLFETENTLIREPEAAELAYDKLESVIIGHRESLRTTTGEKAAHAYAPQTNSTFTPVMLTTGASDGTRKRLQAADLVTLKGMYDVAEIQQENRFLVLHPLHVGDLILEDMKAFKDITEMKDGQPSRFAGFNILQFSRTAKYNPATLQKIAFRSANPGNFCSFSFVSDEVFKADGTIKMYATLHEPKERASIVGFEKRFIALPVRNKGNGAIVSANP